MMNGIECFEKNVCGYFNEDGLTALTYSSWHLLMGTSSDDKLQLDAKLALVKQNLTKFEKSLRDRRVNHIPAFLKNNGLQFEEMIVDGEINNIEELTMNNGLQHLLVHPEVVTAVCSYLLYVVSCHSDPVIVNSASNTLSYHVENGAVFAPDRSQILAIALNMGMKEEFLPDFSREELPQYVRKEGAANSQARAEYPEPFHVKQVVSCLTELLQLGRGWTDTARDALFSVLVAMLVDTYMNDILMTPHVTICLDRLVNSYEKTVWTDQSKMLDLVERLGDLPRAARLLVLSGLPRLGRGLDLRRVTAYFYLQHAISEQHPERARSEGPTFDLPSDVTVADILAAVRGERDLPPATFSSATSDDLENFFTVLKCTDAAVGAERLPRAQLEHLRKLMRLMQKQVDRVKDNNDGMCMLRIQLKELMTVLNSKWTRMSQKPVIQTTLDSWSQ